MQLYEQLPSNELLKNTGISLLQVIKLMNIDELLKWGVHVCNKQYVIRCVNVINTFLSFVFYKQQVIFTPKSDYPSAFRIITTGRFQCIKIIYNSGSSWASTYHYFMIGYKYADSFPFRLRSAGGRSRHLQEM